MADEPFKVALNSMLNMPGFHTVAAISGTINKSCQFGTITITDCFKTVSLELQGWNRDVTENTLFKLEVLLEIIGELHDVMMEHWDEHEMKGWKK